MTSTATEPENAEGQSLDGLGQVDGALVRAVHVLQAFETGCVEMSAAELSELTGLPRSTTYRIITQLCRLELLFKTEKGYRLGRRIFLLGQQEHAHRMLREVALPYLLDLYEISHENVSLGLRSGSSLLYLDKINGHKSSDIAAHVGKRFSMHCSALGKALLAHSCPSVVDAILEAGLSPRTSSTITNPDAMRKHLDEVRRRGFAVNNEESRCGMVAVAAPVFGHSQFAVAAIGLAGPVESRVRDYASAVTLSGLALTRALRRPSSRAWLETLTT